MSLVINEEQKWLERAAAEKCNAMHLLNSASAKQWTNTKCLHCFSFKAVPEMTEALSK